MLSSENQLMVTRQGRLREGIVREFGMDMYTLLHLKPMRSSCIAQGTLLNVMWQPGWKEGLGKDGYMYMYG